MKLNVREIYLSWRKGRGGRRNLIGVLKRTSTEGISFQYLRKGCEKAEKEGFKEYPGFALDFRKIYRESNLDVFSLRLIPFDRSDNIQQLKFWEAENVKDKFDLLALTQGLMPTDNFEFLAKFHPNKGLKFVTDIAGLSYIKPERNSVQVGDSLQYEIEANDSAYMDRAIKIFHHNNHLGYIKNVHNCVFLQSKKTLKLRVKAIEQNGFIKNLFVVVDCNNRF